MITRAGIKEDGFEVLLVEDSETHRQFMTVMLDKLMADRLRGVLRESDTAARNGGDEFTVILQPIISAEPSDIFAGNILDSVMEQCVVDGVRLSPSCSIAIAVYPDTADDVGGLLRHADEAMYRAKKQGGGGFSL